MLHLIVVLIATVIEPFKKKRLLEEMEKSREKLNKCRLEIAKREHFERAVHSLEKL